MKEYHITVTAKSFMFSNEKTFEFIAKPDDPLSVILHKTIERSGSMSGDLVLPQTDTELFGVPYFGMPYEGCLPHVISKGKIVWDPEYSDVAIKDFVDSYQLKKPYLIEVEVDIPAAGGPGFAPLEEVWNSLQIILNDPKTALLVSLSIPFFSWLKKRLKGKTTTPYRFLGFIYSRRRWKISELEKYLEENQDTVKQLLLGLGFKWKKKKKLFVKTRKARRLEQKLSNIE